MAGGVASTLLDAARWRRRDRRRARPVRGRRVLARPVVPAAAAAGVLLGNLFRDQLDRYGELETIADRWAASCRRCRASTALVLNADDPLIADLGRGRGAVTYFGVEDRSLAIAGDAARVGLQALPPLRRRVRLRGDLPRPPRALPCPVCGQRRPEPTVCAPSGSRWTAPARRASRSHVRPGGRRAAAAAGSLQRLQRAGRGGAVRLARDRRPTQIAAGLERVTAAFGRAETDHDRRPRAGDPADQEPRRRERDAADARARARTGSTCSRSSTTAPPTAATSPGSGTPTSSCWRRVVRQRHVLPGRAPPSWRSGSSTPGSPRTS